MSLRPDLHRAKRALVLSVALLLLAIAPAGCFVGRAIVNGTDALFSSPRKVTQNKRPVLPDARLAVVWVGHATALIQIDDKVILTDPVFTSTVGQFSKRVVEPGIDPKDLPPIDAVLVSHMHYDHLSLGSLDAIESKVRTLLLPRGGTTYLTDSFSFPAYELHRWQAWERQGLRITAVPVNHVGWRYGIDGDWMKESFTGYVIEYHDMKVYFGGDTAYDQALFVETGQRFKDIDLALIPIAPIEPRDFMRHYHLDPAEAVQAFIDLGARRMVPIHYDTFISSSDKPGDARAALKVAGKRWDLGRREIVPVAIGERRVFIAKDQREQSGSTPSAPSFPPPATTPAPAPTPTTSSTSNIPDEDSFE